MTDPAAAENRRHRTRVRALVAVVGLALVVSACAAGAVLLIRGSRMFQEVDPVLLGASAPRREELGAGPGIVLLGDSWVAYDKLTQPLVEGLAERGLRAHARSYGHPGATSRRILRNLFEPETAPHASAAALADPTVRFAVVIAGVNDSASHLGADFYAYHVVQIARVLRSHGIEVLLLELPEYGIEQVHAARDPARWLKHELFVQAVDDGEVDVIGGYRSVLRRELAAAGLEGEVHVIGFEGVVASYEEETDLFRDPAHLNEAGQERLVTAIADALAARMRPSSLP